MTEKNRTNIVHESEAQRQYVRVQMPLKLRIGEHDFVAVDWSNGGVALEWPRDLPKEAEEKFAHGRALSGTLSFPFEEFDMSLPVDMEIRYIDRDRRRVGCRFTNLSPQQLSMLQYFVGAYISGEIVRVGDVMDVATRNNFTTARKLPALENELTRGQLIRRKARHNGGMIILSLLGILLGLYVAMGLYERKFVVAAQGAQVDTDLVILRVPGGGTVFYQPVEPGTKVEKGKPLVMVSTDNGTMISLDSPCDCIVSSRPFHNYDRVKAFDGVLNLVPVDAKQFVTATVPYASAVRVTKGQTAMLRMPGHGVRMKGRVKDVLVTGPTGATTHVTITPEQPLGPQLVGEPVDVSIDTF